MTTNRNPFFDESEQAKMEVLEKELNLQEIELFWDDLYLWVHGNGEAHLYGPDFEQRVANKVMSFVRQYKKTVASDSNPKSD